MNDIQSNKDMDDSKISQSEPVLDENIISNLPHNIQEDQQDSKKTEKSDNKIIKDNLSVQSVRSKANSTGVPKGNYNSQGSSTKRSTKVTQDNSINKSKPRPGSSTNKDKSQEIVKRDKSQNRKPPVPFFRKKEDKEISEAAQKDSKLSNSSNSKT